MEFIYHLPFLFKQLKCLDILKEKAKMLEHYNV
jgi:hypothetical protein